jgi:hypothetical protein
MSDRVESVALAADVERDVKPVDERDSKAIAQDAVLALTVDNALDTRAALKVQIVDALALEVKGDDVSISDEAYALVLADVAAAHKIYGYGEYAGAAEALDRLVNKGVDRG